MFDYLQQFNKLPKNLREKVSSSAVMANINELEKKYGVDLAALVMKIMVKSVPAENLAMHLISEFRLEKDIAMKLAADLVAKVLFDVRDYLGLAELKMPKDEAIIKDTSSESKPASPIAAAPLEVDNFSQRINQYIEQVVKELNISFSSEHLLLRFRAIIRTYLRGIRGRVETRETLSKSVNGGGLGFDNIMIDRILATLEKVQKQKQIIEKVEIKNPRAAIVDKIVKLSAPDQKIETKKTEADYSLKAAILERQQKNLASPIPVKLAPPKAQPILPKKIDQKLVTPPKVRITPPTPVADFPKETARKTPEAVVINPKEIAKEINLLQKQIKTEAPVKPTIETSIPKPKEEPKKQSLPKPIIEKPKVDLAKKVELPPRIVEKENIGPTKNITDVQMSNSLGKKKLEDIRKPKVMTPIEELRYLDLVNFRRLSKDPKEAVAKIDQKIKLLENNSYGQMLAGISAWRESQINKLYSKIVVDALKLNKNIEEIIAHRRDKGEPYLEIEEINQIIELNNNLMFQ